MVINRQAGRRKCDPRTMERQLYAAVKPEAWWGQMDFILWVSYESPELN